MSSTDGESKRRQEGDHSSKRWEAILEGFRLANEIKKDEEARLFRGAAGYLAAMVTIATFLAQVDEPERVLHPLFLVAIAIANSFYAIFYSYSSALLMQAAHFQKCVVNEARRGLLGEDARYLDWEEFSQGPTGAIRKVINGPKTSWRAFPVVIAVATTIVAFARSAHWWEYFASIGSLGVAAMATVAVGASVHYVFERSRFIRRGAYLPSYGLLEDDTVQGECS